MQSFGWKRKKIALNEKLSAFIQEGGSDEEDDVEPDVDWLTAAKRPKVLLLEDNKSKAKRLRDEGVTLAHEERYWEAIGRWISTISLTPDDHQVHDMLAQAYMNVGEIFPALSSASSCTSLAPLWWQGFQTLGRSQLGVGEVSMAIVSFSKAIRLAPDQEDLWKEDLQWAINLRTKQKELEKESARKHREDQLEKSLILEEINEDYVPTSENTPEYETEKFTKSVKPCYTSTSKKPSISRQKSKSPASTNDDMNHMIRYRR